MDNWIDKLEEKREWRRAAEERSIEPRERMADNAPEFWRSLLTCIKADCDEVIARFPDEPDYHCTLFRTATGFGLSVAGQPRPVIEAYLYLGDQCAQIRETVKLGSGANAVKTSHALVDIEAATGAVVQVRYKGKVHNSPQSLAEDLVSFACGVQSSE